MSRAALGNGIELEYETFGSPADPALLLVMGFTAQLTLWDEEFCRQLAAGGRFVIRFDNRDCGLSTHLDGVHVDVQGVLDAALTGGSFPEVPYLLRDMAADAVGLLDHLGIERAHVLGASMGGMIVQTMAIEFPQRLLSLTSVMSQTGEPNYGQPTPEAAAVLLAPPPQGRDDYIESSVRCAVWQSQRYRNDERTRANAARDYDRSFYPEGAGRQLGAIFASGSRAEQLRDVTAPALVIHGRDDTLISPDGGFRTAELIPGAHLLFLADMGHDLPEQLWPVVVPAVLAHTSVARAAKV